MQRALCADFRVHGHCLRIEVTGGKADGVPVLRRPDDEAEGSRGLRLVEELAARWGYERGGGHFQVDCAAVY